jgi:Family of unknown function (DUF6499)
MRSNSGWRSPKVAEDFAGHDNADFAQEFLRRNPDYRREYSEAQLGTVADEPDRSERLEGLARRWGMTFPVFARCRAAGCSSTLGTDACRDNRHHRCRAARA